MARLTFTVLVILLLAITSCGLVPGESSFQQTSFTVAPSAKYTIAIEARAGQNIEGFFSVSGQENYIDFYIKDSTGGLVYGAVRAQGGHSFEAHAETTSVYTLYFDNSISFGSSRDISLRFRVR